ncbi:MAG: hypothetical protein DWQ07_10185 [Chloroflexi bacterium]|nr:MAG: hypothetical protein DWQ07_10185 [Chloroflexota bacterium]MBL1192921.1 hypothetical protein [Chloroflexota bacterium]NOH10214.1 hypothetical protein [Chloroflexota bacterium]
MTEETIILLLFLFVLILGAVLWGFQIYVARQLTKLGEEKVEGSGRKRSWRWVYTLVLGWQRARDAEIVDVMVTWSILTAIWFTLIAVLARALAVYNPG